MDTEAEADIEGALCGREEVEEAEVGVAEFCAE